MMLINDGCRPCGKPPGDVVISFVYEYSLLCASFLCMAKTLGMTCFSSQDLNESISKCIDLFTYGGVWPSHGHDRDLDLDCFRSTFSLGLEDWIQAADPSTIPNFYLAAEALVQQEALEGPWRSPWVDGDKQKVSEQSQFSALGVFCLKALGEKSKKIRQGRQISF